MSRSRQACDSRDLLQGPGDVAGPRKNHQGRVLGKRRDDLARIPVAAFVAVDGHQLAAATVAQVCQWPAHGVVFERAGDNAASWLSESVDGDVQGLGGIHAKAHTLGPVRTQQLGQRFARAINDGRGFQCAAVRATSARTSDVACESVHRKIDRLGFGVAGSCVVEIDRFPCFPFAGYWHRPQSEARKVPFCSRTLTSLDLWGRNRVRRVGSTERHHPPRHSQQI